MSLPNPKKTNTKNTIGEFSRVPLVYESSFPRKIKRSISEPPRHCKGKITFFKKILRP
jgi:hypothetical protein